MRDAAREKISYPGCWTLHLRFSSCCLKFVELLESQKSSFLIFPVLKGLKNKIKKIKTIQNLLTL